MKRWIALLLAVCLLGLAGASSAAGGSAADPIVTQSYLEESYLPAMLDKSSALIADRFDTLLEDFLDGMNERSSAAAICAAYLHRAGYTVDASYGIGGYSAAYGDLFALGLGTILTVASGSAEIVLANGEMVDITEGTE